MSTSDRTRDPLGLNEKRYTEEGISLPERGSAPAPHDTSSQVDILREPEKLTIPAESVRQLVHWALRTELGNAWWAGFVTAHGVPTWLERGEWRLVARDVVEVVKAPPAPKPTNGLVR